ncbi:ABC transporter ATP-binding protein [Pediococcus stilesii]|uniref:Branched-chain amino acid ABC transporter, ATP-binding protein n=1 Tax=Pediococcus stilesii TaxID=331679 RepID=A0A0R2L561_9LACO|nr:ABC transporter ATP-binding protein [Pediococcus stilesii]KRN94442.1 branched-chain amino acid ABC transporter, ATP-binding protein [Pediococcus stilesii]
MAGLLKIDNLAKKFGGLTAVSNVSMHLNQNELVALIGPNGAGKTTLFNLLTGVISASSGSIVLDGRNGAVTLNGKKASQIAQMGLARTFQNIRLFKEMTVVENVMVAMTDRFNENFFSSIFRTPAFYKKEQMMKDEALKLLTIFNLEKQAETKAKNLPYGIQRRLEIVRTLATNPQILFLDEPAAGMNPEETADLTRLIIKVQKMFQITILLIEHDMSLVMNVAERIYVLDHGSLLAEGTPAEIQDNDQVIKAYLGEEV